MNDVVRVDVRRRRSPISRREIFQKLNAGTCVFPHSSNAQMRAKNLIQVLLFGPKIFALACFAHAKQIAIKLETPIRVRNANRCVIDAEK
jgi:hypothetical protein